MPFSLGQLASFAALARERNYSRVAEAAGLTQPAVAHQIRALENDFGVRLVDMAGRRVELTEAGAFLAERAPLVLDAAAALERDLRDFADAAAGRLYLGATLTIGSTLLPDALARFAVAHPAVAVEVEIANTAVIAAMLRSGRLSAALIEGFVDDPALAVEPFFDDELVLIAPPQHPLAGSGPVTLAALRDLPFIAREPGSGTRELFERALATHGITPRIVLAIPSGEGVVRAVAHGLGIAAVSRLVCADAIVAGQVAAIDAPQLALRRSLVFVTRAGRARSPAVSAFRELL
jgi:DNA-binding transcriptional LysR family regulator